MGMIEAWENQENRSTYSGVPSVIERMQSLGIDPSKKQDSKLDGPETRGRFHQVIQWWQEERSLQTKNRKERLKAHKYYDHEQWEQEDILELEARGQDPLVFNLIKPSVDWICGTEKRTRVDYRVLPREKNDAKGAVAKTQLLKYVCDVNKSQYSRSQAFKDAVISGLGWLDVGIRSDPDDEPLYIRYEDWRNVWHDSRGTARDLKDHRYVFRSKYIDLDMAIAMFPERAGAIIASSIQENTFYDDITEIIEELELDPEYAITRADEDALGHYSRRSRVRLIECQYKSPTKVDLIRGENLGALSGATFDPADQAMLDLVNSGYATVVPSIRPRVRSMIFTGNYVIRDDEWPYRHNRFSLVPIWGFQRKVDGTVYGIVQGLFDPQYDLNKRRSKALFQLSTNQVIADDDATDDWDELYDEAQRPDGLIKKKRGAEVQIRDNAQLAEEHVMLMQDDRKFIESVGGVTDENLGKETNAVSGRAIRARQEQGQVVTTELFDNMIYSIQHAGEIQVSLMEQFYTMAKTIRLLGDKGEMDFVQINQPETGDESLPENDITRSVADFKVDTQNYNATLRQAMFETLGEMLGQMPGEVSIQLLDLWIDLSDLPGKDIMVQRIRQINGQTSPDEDPDDPEVAAEREAKEEAERQQAEMEQRLMELELAAKEAAVAKDSATAEETMAKIEEIGAKVEAILAKIAHDREALRIKRAEALAKIEHTEQVAKKDTQPALQGGPKKPRKTAGRRGNL